MQPRTSLIITTAVVVVVCHAQAPRGEAKVVRDGKTGPSNPPVEAGGYRLLPQGNGNRPSVVISYSLIGRLPTEFSWLQPFAPWPFAGFNPFCWNGRSLPRITPFTGLGVQRPRWVR